MAMNIFRLCGDMLHITAIMLLLQQLRNARNARGISVKTQELRLMVFVTRYLDLFTTFYSYYNSILKVLYPLTTSIIIYVIRTQHPIPYNAEQDDFPHLKFAVAPCVLLAFVTHLAGSGIQYFSLIELLWTFSIYLESVAILPQLLVLRKYRLVENLTGKFVVCLGLYRFFYILNWIYRSKYERFYRHHWLVYICGVVQTLLYVDFFYQYMKARRCCSTCCGNDNRDEEVDNENGLVFELSASELSSEKERLASAINDGSVDKPLLILVDEEDGSLDDMRQRNIVSSGGE